MKYTLLVTFLGFANATHYVNYPEFAEAEIKFGGADSWPSCTPETESTDCDTDYFCLNHKWDADTDNFHFHESGTGCWPAAVCMGSGTYDWIIGKLQFFCTQEQHDTAASMDAPFDLHPAEKNHDEFTPACAQDSDCPYENSRCWRAYFDATEDGKAFGNGVACDDEIPDAI